MVKVVSRSMFFDLIDTCSLSYKSGLLIECLVVQRGIAKFQFMIILWKGGAVKLREARQEHAWHKKKTGAFTLIDFAISCLEKLPWFDGLGIRNNRPSAWRNALIMSLQLLFFILGRWHQHKYYSRILLTSSDEHNSKKLWHFHKMVNERIGGMNSYGCL